MSGTRLAPLESSAGREEPPMAKAKARKGKLKRRRNPMPRDVAASLRSAGLRSAYAARPAYQRNDYLWWIGAAKRDTTREKRLKQMLSELKSGKAYMGMSRRAAH
jgi:uncharacterized protein YdeI (YjbR/CyaY-like superfamily)